MPRTTLLDAKNEGLPSAIGRCADDAVFLTRLNTACRRLLKRGKYWGTFGRYRMCVTDGCLTLPPQIATLESVAVCGRPLRVHDQWFEFLENGLGIQQVSSTTGSVCGVNGSGCAGDAKYRGRYPTFQDVTGTDKKLWLVCDLAADVGKEVLVMGYDENNNWIRTVQDGVMADGEVIALAQSPGTVSSNIFSIITDVQLNETRDGQCWLYSLAPAYDPTTSDKVMLANYQYFETRPSYARYYIGGILSGTSDDNGNCSLTTVDVMAKHDFIPAVKDNDYLVIGNLDALEFMIQALEKYRNAVSQAQVAEAMAFEKLAENELDKELDHYRGSGVVTGITISGNSIGVADPAPNFI